MVPEFRRRDVLRLAGAATLAGCTPGSRRATPVRPFDEFVTYDATGLAALVRQGEVTPLELVDVVIARIEAFEGTLNALTTRTFGRARERAMNDQVSGPFAGVPFMYKDLVDVAGIPRTNGAHSAFTRTPTASPAYIQAVEASGLNIVAATNTPAFTTLPTTVNIRFGATANPWKLDRSPAGSSGGSAVAVAAGYVPLAHGTDGAGSIRMPASYCGVFGFKPSRARTLSGEADGHHDLIKHHHALSRTVRDSARLLNVTEDTGADAAYPALGFVEGPAPRRLRIGVDAGGLFGLAPDAAQQAALDEAQSLCSALGHSVFEASQLPINGEEFWEQMGSVFLSRMPALIAWVEAITGKPFESNEILSPLATSMALESKEQEPGARARAEAYFTNLNLIMQEYMAKMDVLLSPVLPFVQPPIDIYSPYRDYGEDVRSMQEFMSYTALANATGAPAMSVPLYWTADNLPLGTHFYALPGQDRMLMELAYDLETARPWKQRWAPHSIGNLNK